MITVTILIIWAHFIGDFICQTDWHAQNKSKNNWILAHHVLGYSIPLLILGFLVPVSVAWIIVNALAHFVTDYITSRITSHLWAKKETHWFFVTIGADQAIHMTTLILTYYYMCAHL